MTEQPTIHPKQIFNWINNSAAPETRIVADIGNSALWAAKCLATKNPTETIMNWRFGAMGWGIGTAIGLAVANASKPVICITGAAGMLMYGQELIVAREHDLNITFIILNDSSPGMVKHGQRVGGAADMANKPPTVNFSSVATGYGIPSLRLKSDRQLQMPMLSTEPFLYDICIDPKAVLPFHNPVAQLREAVAHKGNHYADTNGSSTNTVSENNRPFTLVKKNRRRMVFAVEELNSIMHGLLDAIPRARNDMDQADPETSAMLQHYLKRWLRIVGKIVNHLNEHRDNESDPI